MQLGHFDDKDVRFLLDLTKSWYKRSPIPKFLISTIADLQHHRDDSQSYMEQARSLLSGVIQLPGFKEYAFKTLGRLASHAATRFLQHFA